MTYFTEYKQRYIQGPVHIGCLHKSFGSERYVKFFRDTLFEPLTLWYLRPTIIHKISKTNSSFHVKQGTTGKV